MSRIKWLASICTAFILAACSEPEAHKVGFYACMEGRHSGLGLAGRNGVIQAVSDANLNQQQQIELVVRNCAPPDEVNRIFAEFQALGVKVVIGPMTSSHASVALPIAESHNILLFSPTATSSAFTGVDDGLLRVVSDTEEYARYAAKIVRTEAKRVALLYDQRNKAYSHYWRDAFTRHFADSEHEVIAAGFDSSDIRVLNKVVASVAMKQPELLLVVANASDTAHIAQIAHSRMNKIHIMAAEWSALSKLTELGGHYVEGMRHIQFFDRRSTKKSYIDFSERYSQRFGRPVEFATLAGYDATTIAIQALYSAGAGSLKEKIIASSPYEGVQGHIKMDAFGDSERAVHLSVIRGGEYIQVTDSAPKLKSE